jgi:hypothetical protein
MIMGDFNNIYISTWLVTGGVQIGSKAIQVIPLLPNIDTNMMREVFSADVKKDGLVAPQVKNEHLEKFKKTDCGFGPAPFPVPWNLPLTNLSTTLQQNGRDWLIFPNLLKNSTTGGNVETQVLNSDQYKSVGYDTGPYGTTVFAGDPANIPPTTSTVASMLDTASASISDNNFWPPLENYKDLPHILIIETAVCERLGLPSGSFIATATTINPVTKKASYNFKFRANMFPGIILQDTIEAPNGYIPPQHINNTFKKYLLGNKVKNEAINKASTSDEDRKKLLLFKELSDILGVLYQAIYSHVEQKSGILLTVDSVLFYRAIFLGHPCLCSGIRKKVKPGHATYYYYESNYEIKPIETIKDILSRNVRDIYKSLLGHNMLNIYYLTQLKTALENIKYVYTGPASEKTPALTVTLLGYYYIENKIFKERSRSRGVASLMSKAKVPANIQKLLGMSTAGASPALASAEFEEIKLSQLVKKCELVGADRIMGITHQMIIENIILQIGAEIEKIILASIELIKLSICCLGMIGFSSIQQRVIDTQTDDFIPVFAPIPGSIDIGTFDATIRGRIIIDSTNYRPDIASIIESITAGLTDTDIRQLIAHMSAGGSDLINNFMTVIPADLAGPFTKPEAFTKQTQYINRQIALVSDNIRIYKCPQYISVIHKSRFVLLRPELLCYDIYTYETGGRGKRIGKDTVLSKTILDDDDEDEDDEEDEGDEGDEGDYIGGMFKSRKDNKSEARSRSNTIKASKRRELTEATRKSRKKDELSYRRFEGRNFLDVDPMYVICCKSALMCFLYSPNIKLENEESLNGLEKLHILVKIFYDILVEHYPNIYKLANNLITHYGFSEEEINEVGYTFSNIIEYHKTPYKLFEQAAVEVFSTRVAPTTLISSIRPSSMPMPMATAMPMAMPMPMPMAMDTAMPILARGHRYKNIEQTKKVKQILNVKKTKKAKQAKQAKHAKKAKKAKRAKKTKKT